MNKLLSVLMVILMVKISHAQHLFRATIEDESSKQPIVGATVYFPDLKKGNVTDVNGNVVVSGIPEGTYDLELSFVGYEKRLHKLSFPLADSLKEQKFYLSSYEEELEEIIITSTRSTRTIEDMATRVEFIAGEELGEKGNMKPGDIRMLLNESTGIQTQQTSATSYNSSIRIQGLDGKYTQLLRDGMPLYSGFSGGLSLMQIAPLDLKQVEVIKGATSTLYGAGAIAGIVNLISKKPEDEPELRMMLNGTSAQGLDASAFYAQKYGKIGTTVFTSYNLGRPYDPADIGLTAIPKFDRFTLNPKVFVYLSRDTELYLGLNYVTEDRLGGNFDYIKGKEVVNPYFESNNTDRISTQFRAIHNLNDYARIEAKNSVSYYDRAIEIPNYQFAGYQVSSFSEINLSSFNKDVEWVGGLNLWTDKFIQSNGFNGQNLSFSNTILGGFIQNTWSINNRWSMETGLRSDYHSNYGFFALPRLSLMVQPTEALTFRLGGGLGYKTPTIFSEDAERIQFRNIDVIEPDSLDAEHSYGGNFDINYRLSLGDNFTLSTNTLFFYTRINNPLYLNNNGSVYQYQQTNGFTDAKGLEINLKWTYGDFNLFVGYTYADVKQHNNGVISEATLVAKNRLNNVLMYEKEENFWIGLEAYYYSPQKLGDGTTGQSYWIVGLMAEKHLGERISIFVNFENFLDTRQTAFDTIYTGNLSDPQFRDIYAPVDGFVINGGLKARFL